MQQRTTQSQLLSVSPEQQHSHLGVASEAKLAQHQHSKLKQVL